MPLTVYQVKNAKSQPRLYRLSDGNGLALEVTPKGSKRWRFRYSFSGNEKMLSLGLFPEVSLKDARERCFENKQLVAKNIDPSELRQAKRAKATGQDSFETIAKEWFEKNKPIWTENHAGQIWRRLELYIFPWLGKTTAEDITPSNLLKQLRRIESKGAVETAHRVKGCCGQIYRYAVATGRAERDISQDLKDALTPVKHTHFSTITEPRQIGALLRSIDDYQGHYVTKAALKLAPLVFVRPGELRHAEWEEVDSEESLWKIPAEKMKARQTHLVPLSTQAMEVIEELRSLTGKGRYLFPSIRTNLKPISNNAVNSALRRMGYTKEEMTGHGFRSMASTLLNEQGWKWDAIERQLAHAERNNVRAAYNYAEYLPERKEMMQAWADFLEECKVGHETSL